MHDYDEDDDYDDNYALLGPPAAAGASEVDMPVLLEDVLKGLPAISPARSPPAHDLRSWGGDAEPVGAAWGADEHEHAALGPDGAAPVLRAPGTRAPGFFAALRLVYGRGQPLRRRRGLWRQRQHGGEEDHQMLSKKKTHTKE